MRPVRAIERVAECNDGKIWLTVICLDLLKMLSDAIIAIENKSVKNNPQISENANDSILSIDPMSHLGENILVESTEQNFALEECDLSANESPVPAKVASLQDHQPVQSGLDILHHTSNSPENNKTTAFKELTRLSRQPDTDHYSTDMVQLLTKHSMISFDSCCSIGVNLGMDRNDVLKSIIYLHSMALFLFFPKVLPNNIFTNPQYLPDVLSALIRFSFVESLEAILPVNQCLEVDAKQIFHEEGVFDSSLLGKLCLPFVAPLFSDEKFFKLLRYPCILASLFSNETQKQYFMPVVLPPCHITEEDTSVFRMSCDPMIITFETKVVLQV